MLQLASLSSINHCIINLETYQKKNTRGILAFEEKAAKEKKPNPNASQCADAPLRSVLRVV